MAGYVYLVRNKDLFKIGRTNNLQRIFKSLKPDEIVKTLETEYPRALEARLLRRYKSKRIPDSEYFRLSKKQVLDCKRQLGAKGSLPSTLGAEVSIGLTGSFLLIFATSFTLLYFGQGLFHGIAYALFLGSIPMWVLFILGNFGGYDINDLPLFSSWTNRLKALFFAVLISLIAYSFLLLP
tara:strand:- start:66536 stop:67078 length:543 start_codon:yes stop_codon:yes gene_type:complete